MVPNKYLSLIALLSIVFLANTAIAGGLSYGLGVGKTDAKITNNDSSEAYYDAMTFQGKLGVNIIETNDFTTSLHLKMKYLDLENRANNSAQRETGSHFGSGACLEFRWYRMKAGYEVYMMQAKHYWVGDTTNSYSKFDYQSMGWFAGLEFPVGSQVGLGLFYASYSADLSASDLGTTSDVPFTENTISLQLTVTTKDSFGKFLGSIFGF